MPLQAAGWSLVGGVTLASALALTAPPPRNLEPQIVRPPRTEAHDGAVAGGAGHLKMPAEVRGFYMTSSTAASSSRRAELIAYARRNDLNAVVIDIKDFGGKLAFGPRDAVLETYAPAKPTIPDLDEVLKEMKDAHLYRIARLFVFQDPEFARRNPKEAVLNGAGKVWVDYKGVSWVDPASKADWKYNLEVAKEAYARGFDEIQLDYIRFPSDGKLTAIRYARWDGKTPKQAVIHAFYDYMHRELARRGIALSLDLFGYVTWYRDFDLGIGQLLVNGLPNAAAISAMVYPSHYQPGTLGYDNPAKHPYEVVKTSLERANTLYADHKKTCATGAGEMLISGAGTSKIALACGVDLAGQRPWLQAFDLGAVYTAELIDAEIKAAREEGASGYLLWNARNVYRDFNQTGKMPAASAVN